MLTATMLLSLMMLPQQAQNINQNSKGNCSPPIIDNSGTITIACNGFDSNLRELLQSNAATGEYLSRSVERLLDATERISPAAISAEIVLTNSIDFVDVKEKPLSLPNATMELRAAVGKEIAFSPIRWIATPNIVEYDAKISTDDQRSRVKGTATTAGMYAQEITTFTEFRGELKNLSTITAWEGAAIDIIVRIPGPNSWLNVLLSKASGDDTYLNFYQLPHDYLENFPDKLVTTLPVSAKITLFLNQQPIGTSDGLLVKIREHDDDASGTHIIHFKPFITHLPTAR